eukprot:13265366-Ditylum_brightwellii.AAC.1
MLFGWKISTVEEEPIAEHAGPAFCKASSFRAKGYGVLSALSFFRRSMEHMATTTKLKGQLYLDNKDHATSFVYSQLIKGTSMEETVATKMEYE